MTHEVIAAALTFGISLGLGAPVFAQAPVTGAADPESLFTDEDPVLHANKQIVLHVVRDLLEANHWSDAPQYISERYIQHNPNVASGLAPVMKFFGSRTPGVIPDRSSWKTKVVAVLADGDLVTVATARELPDPRNAGKTYTTAWFDMWRIKDGSRPYCSCVPPSGMT